MKMKSEMFYLVEYRENDYILEEDFNEGDL